MAITGMLFVFLFGLVSTGAEDEPLQGFTRANSATEREWEAKFRAIPSPDNQREYMRRLSARPHHVGSAYDKENAEWILSKFKEWGWDAKIETFTVLYPTPKERVLEMVAPTRFTAKLQEPPLAVDPTSNQQSEQLPSYNAYSIDGDVTAPLVFVNYGLPKDYEQLERLGVSVKGRHRHRQVRQFLARDQAQGRRRTRRNRLPDLFRPCRRRLRRGQCFPARSHAPFRRRAARQRSGFSVHKSRAIP